MLRRVLPRFPLFRIRAPILPTTARIGTRSAHPASVTGLSRSSPSRFFRTFTPRLMSTGSPGPNDNGPSLPPDATVSQRLKHLVKSYGCYALGMYLVLSALDFTIAFAGVNLLGAEQVSQVAACVKGVVLGFIHRKPLEDGKDGIDSTTADQGGQEGLYAMLVLAYTIHKTLFLPVRVGLTAALTPKMVGWLRMRGWAGGEGTKRAAREMREKIRNRQSRD
ncbi:hypothetical protein PAXRUDRAFT_825158 [Paxillus rubicundulus Ve08.2h10]|uniref:DUF1279 domain-containing protein n=1 Tax=Paxillus rubicundulus Ve08.2h10 TaxID=930991 RepID=A0A0D0DTI6_9AGAM|nr:hypothetical protein PAXRUDRAFT_825158 [Paxillus rubicundulus Ve08.2h10]